MNVGGGVKQGSDKKERVLASFPHSSTPFDEQLRVNDVAKFGGGHAIDNAYREARLGIPPP